MQQIKFKEAIYTEKLPLQCHFDCLTSDRSEQQILMTGVGERS